MKPIIIKAMVNRIDNNNYARGAGFIRGSSTATLVHAGGELTINVTTEQRDELVDCMLRGAIVTLTIEARGAESNAAASAIESDD